MKILIIIPSLKNGGAERAVTRLYNSLVSMGYKVMVVTFNLGDNDYKVKNLIELNLEPKRFLFFKIFNTLIRAKRLKLIKLKYSADISISFLFGANLVNVISAINSEKIVISVRNSIQKLNFLKKAINDIVFKKADMIVSVSEGIKQELIGIHRLDQKKIRVISNFVKIDSLTESKINPSDLRLISIGRLEEQKAHWHLIYAIYKLRNRFPLIKLIILGRGPLEEALNKLVNDLHIADSVNFLGYKSDVLNYLKTSSVFVFSSRNEGFPNAILEAMNQGLPIIATNIPTGPAEILNPLEIDLYSNDFVPNENKYGLLVDYGSNPKSNQIRYFDHYIVDQFVDKITLLLTNRKIYEHYSKQSLKRIRLYSEEKIVSNWILLFEELKTFAISNND